MITNVGIETRPSGAEITTVEVTDPKEGKYFTYEVHCPVCAEHTDTFFDLLAMLHNHAEAIVLADAHIHGVPA